MAKWKRTVYQRLVRAAKDGSGTYLKPSDVFQLGAQDEAIMQAARIDDESEEAARSQASGEVAK